MILRRFIDYCGKFHTDTIDQTVFGKEFVKLVWGNYFEPMPKTIVAQINPEINIIFLRSSRGGKSIK